MGYFSEHYDDLRYPIAGLPGAVGFRQPQLGALHSVAGHFSQYTIPAVITMPTGSGKTAVLVASAFILRATRVLVIAPSRLIREQLAEQFQRLGDLVTAGAIDAKLPGPKVAVVSKRIDTTEKWRDLADCDVVVGLPQSMSPELGRVASFPASFFDLVLIDEGHHSPARIWSGLMKQVSDARQILFTATPFRRDKRELPGRFVYTYHMREAYRDGLYGKIHYEPVSPDAGVDPDTAIARKTEQILKDDRGAGFDHRVLVRTATIARAKALRSLYEAETNLRLALLTGEHSLRHARAVLNNLRKGQIDGLVVVDMLGEGIDIPNLKISALHAPHRSLGAVLQFIGRFARTNAKNLGRAVFIALKSDIEVEEEKLYADGAIWHEMLPNLAAARVEEEQQVREVLDTFVPSPEPAPETVDVSMHSLRVFHHVKILNIGQGGDFAKQVVFPDDFEIVHRHISNEYATAVYITRHKERPDWAMIGGFEAVTYDLTVVHYSQQSGFLFICTSRRDPSLYEHLASEFAVGKAQQPRNISLRKLNRVLLGIDDARFYNIGMKHATASALNESYRTLAGPSVDQAIKLSDARVYRRGHWFGSGMQNGKAVTIGLSSASKVWSNTVSKIPQLVGWCDVLASKIAGNADPQTFSGLDLLSTGDEVTSIPSEIVYVNWNPATYQVPERFWCQRADGSVTHGQLLDLDLSIDFRSSNQNRLALIVTGDNLDYRLQFSLQTDAYIHSLPTNSAEIRIGDGPAGLTLTNYLNEYLPIFYTADFGVLEGADFTPPSAADIPVFERERLRVHDWTQANVDITKEIGPLQGGKRSIHGYVEDQLVASAADIVFYDHGAGEIADFLTVEDQGRQRLVSFYHCKASGSAQPGARLKDVYEVCSQVSKSMYWTDRRAILRSISQRLATRGGRSRFAKGNLALLRQLLGHTAAAAFLWRIVVVQPGVSQSHLSTQMTTSLAAADDFIRLRGCVPLDIWASS